MYLQIFNILINNWVTEIDVSINQKDATVLSV